MEGLDRRKDRNGERLVGLPLVTSNSMDLIKHGIQSQIN